MANSVDPEQTVPIGAVCSGSMLFVSKLNSSAMLGNYLQQTTSADNIFRCIFFLFFKNCEVQLPMYLFLSIYIISNMSINFPRNLSHFEYWP